MHMADQTSNAELVAAIRLVEQAADELARLDTAVLQAPSAFSLAFQIDVVAPREENTLIPALALVAAYRDPVHADALDPVLKARSDFLVGEEQRVRGGAPLSAARFRDAGFAVRDSAALDAALRPGGQARSVLLRAVAAATTLESSTDRSVVAALLLCGAGVTDRLRLLPFVGVGVGAEDALTAWSEGDTAPWTTSALTELARAARARRLTLADALAAMPDQVVALDALGRASLTARRALDVLREELAVTVPSLAAQLECSRPAASGALDRLVGAGLVAEITGRARDRVFALSAALEAAEIERIAS